MSLPPTLQQYNLHSTNHHHGYVTLYTLQPKRAHSSFSLTYISRTLIDGHQCPSMPIDGHWCPSTAIDARWSKSIKVKRTSMDIAVHRCPLMGIDGHQQACDSMEMLCFTARKSAQVVHSMFSALSKLFIPCSQRWVENTLRWRNKVRAKGLTLLPKISCKLFNISYFVFWNFAVCNIAICNGMISRRQSNLEVQTPSFQG